MKYSALKKNLCVLAKEARKNKDAKCGFFNLYLLASSYTTQVRKNIVITEKKVNKDIMKRGFVDILKKIDSMKLFTNK